MLIQHSKSNAIYGQKTHSTILLFLKFLLIRFDFVYVQVHTAYTTTIEKTGVSNTLVVNFLATEKQGIADGLHTHIGMHIGQLMLDTERS